MRSALALLPAFPEQVLLQKRPALEGYVVNLTPQSSHIRLTFIGSTVAR